MIPAIAAVPTPRPQRPRSRLNSTILTLALLFGITYTIIWNSEEITPRLRRNLTYLDAKPSKSLKYGRFDIDQNFNSLVQPSHIDSDLFRKKKQDDDADAGSNGYTEETACDDVFLFMPHYFGHNGQGSQLNNYMLASMIATFTNRAMVILDPPPALNVFKSNSQFGCPPEAWKTQMVRKGGKPKQIGWNTDFPNGFNRLIKHPQWLSRGCAKPCSETHDYKSWEEALELNNSTEITVPKSVTCQTGSRQTNVIAMGGPQVRHFFQEYYKGLMLARDSNPPTLAAAEWAMRLGAKPHEADIFGVLEDKFQIWEYVSAIMSRSGVLRFQHWIARDAETYIKEVSNLPLNMPYDAIHVRRGDKLVGDSRTHVRKFWEEKGLYNADTGAMPTNYIPFTHYLHEFDTLYCRPSTPRIVYVATDDPQEVQREIDALPKDSYGNTMLSTDSCHKFRFIFSSFDHEKSLGFHIDAGKSKDPCEDRYARNIAGIADLMILAKSDVFVGEFNSNWGRLVRTFRLKMNNSAKIVNGARPVIEREMRVAWGFKRPGPPGY